MVVCTSCEPTLSLENGRLDDRRPRRLSNGGVPTKDSRSEEGGDECPILTPMKFPKETGMETRGAEGAAVGTGMEVGT